MASIYIKENLSKLSKEQLIYIIEQYYDACFHFYPAPAPDD